ncbi:type II toxin-antitoxin system death-on-curing family toxin [Ferroglobus sp.]|uniref:type II toxin-antitoxin system death-on-curing family toxin n=1 Tax=Ferroglobus sp. TaxID=2614230 RepID=UPI0025C27C61|nr:type II toxin-antitoxin system death-on-curing family toxin [Ferroglobus sp.]
MVKRKKFITVEEIIEIHKEIIEKYGGESGILNRGELEFIVDWVNSHPRKSIHWKVAILLRGIVSGHPFVDGNKRTAFEVADTILRSHGYRFKASKSQILKFILELAIEGKSIDEIIKWLKENTEKKGGACRQERREE